MREKKRYLHPIFNIIPISMAAAAAVFFFNQYSALIGAEKEFFIPEPQQTAAYSKGVGRENGGIMLASTNAILFDPESGEILFGKAADEITYPASLTKIMTALVAIENIGDLDLPYTFEYADYEGLYEQNASMAGFAMNETVPIRDILYATLLPSGAEAATALARAAAGTIDDFVALMNKRAVELGMENTHFVNVTGLHDDDHYTTVSDLALLLSEASKNPAFMEAYSALYHTTTQTEQHPNGLKLTSTLVSRLKQLDREREPIIGNKTGYTLEAQMCLSSIAEQNGVRRSVITIGAEGNNRSHPTHLEDAYLLYEKALPK